MMHCSSRTSPLMTVLIPFCDIVIFDFRAEKIRMRTFVQTGMFLNFSRYTLRLLTFIRLLHANLLLSLFKNTMVRPTVLWLYHSITMVHKLY